MKITILSTAYPLRGGIAHFNGLLYEELAKEHDVNVITFKRQYPGVLFPGKTQKEEGDTVEPIPTEVIIDSVNPFNWISIGNKIKNDAPDLLIYKYWMPYFAPSFGTITRIAKRNGKTKAMVICDNVIPHERKPGDITLTKYFFNAVDSFICMSNSVKEDLLTVKPGAEHKLLFHPVYSNFGEAIDKQEARKQLGITEERVILFFGFIREYKGLDTLLHTVALLKDEMNIAVVVAGEFYSDEEKYKKIIRENGLENNVKLYNDFIPTNDVKKYFSCADVVVLPYKSATQSGIVQIANNFGKPIIATNVGGLGEVIKDGYNGYLVEKENPGALADAVRKFYNEGKENEFAANIKRELDNYSWAKFTEGMMQLVKEN